MNAEQKKQLDNICKDIEGLRSQIEDIKGEREGDFEELSETAAEGEKGERLTGIIDNLESAIDNLDLAIHDLNEATAN